MKNLMFACMTLAFVFSSTLEGFSQDVPGRPQISIENNEYDFGEVLQGTKVSHDFVVKNKGKGDLVIQRVVAACGCTAATSTTDPIPPGGEGIIHVEFDTTGFSGEKFKSVRVYTNDSENSSVILGVRGIIESEVKVSPQAIYFEDVIKGASGAVASREVEISLREGSSAKITSVKSFSKNISVEELVSGPARRKIRVSLNPEAPIGDLRERLVVGISGGQVASLNIPVTASIRGEISLKPSLVSFGVIEGSKVLTRSVRLENKGSTPLSINSIKSDSSAIQVSTTEIQKGKIFVLQIKVDPAKVEKDLKAVIEVETNRSEGEPLELSVYGILPPKV